MNNKIQLKKDVWYSIVIIVLLIVITALVGHYSASHATDNMLSPLGKEKPTKIIIKEVYAKEGDPIISEFIRVFKDEPLSVQSKMLYVLSKESGFKENAMNWNCKYLDINGNEFSTSCKFEDRDKAWSVDCGLGQLNVKGTTCPKHLLNYKTNIKEIYKKFKTQGLSAWVASWDLK